MAAMGEREIQAIIEQWRDSARAAGESAHADGRDWEPDPGQQEPGRLTGLLARGREMAARLLDRAGPLRLAAACVAAVAFGVLVFVVLRPEGAPRGGGSVEAIEPEPASVASSPAADPATTAAAPVLPQVDDWFAILQQVDTVRAAAYAAADDSGLDGAYAPGGPALAREQAAIRALRTAGETASNWRTQLLAVSPVEVSQQRATLRVLDQRATYDLVAADGARTTVPAADQAAWLVDLVPAAAGETGWLVVDVRPDVTSQRGQP
jgi:hypothetical protein